MRHLLAILVNIPIQKYTSPFCLCKIFKYILYDRTYIALMGI